MLELRPGSDGAGLRLKTEIQSSSQNMGFMGFGFSKSLKTMKLQKKLVADTEAPRP